MYSVKVPKIINLIIETFYRVGVWHSNDFATVREVLMKLFYFIYYLLSPISILAVVFKTENHENFIYHVEIGLFAIVHSMKFFHIIWRKEEIVALIERIGVYSIDDRERYAIVFKKMENFNKIARTSILITCTGTVFSSLIAPFLGTERKFFFDFAFPLDYKNNEFAFWLAFIFIISEILFSLVVFLFTVLTWFLMISCALRYEILGHQIKNMGIGPKTTKAKKDRLFHKELVAVIKSHLHLKG